MQSCRLSCLGHKFLLCAIVVHFFPSSCVLIYAEKTGTSRPNPNFIGAPGCPADQFDCDNECLPMAAVCNFRADCSDASDEKDCTEESCDFSSSSTCGWDLNNSEGSVIWKLITADELNSSSSKNLNLYPQQGHSGSGYLVLDPIGGKVHDSAEVTSRLIRHSNGECVLSFWYYCNPLHCPLQVFKVSEDTQNKPGILWDSADASRFETSELKWRLAKTFVGWAEQVQLFFKGRLPETPNFVVALDTVTFERCQGPNMKDIETNCSGLFRCDNGHCIDHELVCDYDNDCFDQSDETYQTCQDRIGRCDFEEPCDFYKRDDPLSEFVYATGSKGSVFLPRTDHSTRSSFGKYFSLFSSSSSSISRKNSKKKDSKSKNGPLAPNATKTSRVSSALLTGNQCKLRLWHNIIGKGDDSQDVKLNIYRRDKNSNEGSEVLLRTLTTGQVKDFWRELVLPVVAERENLLDVGDFQLIIEGEVPSDGSGSVSFDDVSLSEDCVMAEGIEPVCPRYQYMCDNSNCYSEDQRCNFVDDCGDNSDEADCGGDCDFSGGLCGWMTAVDAPLIWTTREFVEDLESELRPKVDSLGNKNGRYVFTSMGGGGSPTKDDFAEILSDVFTTLSSYCTFNFAYNVKGTASITVLMQRINDDKTDTLLSLKEFKEQELWTEQSLDIKPQNTPFKLVIRSHYVEGGYTALDNFKFLNCGPNDPNPSEVKEQNCMKKENLCNGVIDCEDDGADELNCEVNYGSCDFDNQEWLSICKWTQCSDGDFKWELADDIHSTETGPQSYLINHDHFIYANGQEKEAGAKAIVSTPVFNSGSSGHCQMVFYAYMFGSSEDTWSLRVSSRASDESSSVTHLTLVGNNGPEWLLKKEVTVGLDRPFRVHFEATVGEEGKSDVALGKVWFSRGCTDEQLEGPELEGDGQASGGKNTRSQGRKLGAVPIFMVVIGVLAMVAVAALIGYRKFQKRSLNKQARSAATSPNYLISLVDLQRAQDPAGVCLPQATPVILIQPTN